MAAPYGEEGTAHETQIVREALAGTMVGRKLLTAVGQAAPHMLVLDPRQSDDVDIQCCDVQQRQ